MWEKVSDWGWSLVLLVLGGAATIFTRWLSMLHKHEKQLAILEHEQASRLAANDQMVRNVAEMNTRLEVHRKESMDRMDALRRELREDFNTLIEFHTRNEERERHRAG